MSAFNLRDVVAEVLDESPLNDPRDLAALVLGRIPECERERALLALLPSFVSNVMGATHRAAVTTPPESAPESPRVGASRFAGLRDYILNTRVNGADGTKFFGECGAADLLALIEQREALSRGNLAWAAKYRRVLDALLESGVERVADLGAERVRDLMHPQAVTA